jgi:hypothetical protein
MKSNNNDAYLNPKPQVPRTQNQALHEEAIALILQTKTEAVGSIGFREGELSRFLVTGTAQKS